ncbi:nuclear transport factor 2 family protein [Streptomyces griseoloalbus]|uniref:nuclear transport factor 2 family protein n=1 Tax=Streptomyces griseoloalbus TaxID=67303 RepID=UPI0033AD0877
MTTQPHDYDAVVRRYFEAWNAEGAQARAGAVAEVWTVDGRYTDPVSDATGHEAIGAVIAAVHERFPGFVFRPVGGVEGHHDTARFSWELVSGADGSAPVAGSDVITLDAESRVRAVYGFLDRVPEGA